MYRKPNPVTHICIALEVLLIIHVSEMYCTHLSSIDTALCLLVISLSLHRMFLQQGYVVCGVVGRLLCSGGAGGWYCTVTPHAHHPAGHHHYRNTGRHHTAHAATDGHIHQQQGSKLTHQIPQCKLNKTLF